MINLSEIKQMSTEEKLHLMDVIWQELSLDEKQIEVPRQHKEMLDKRAKKVKEGQASFLDWDDAKKQIEKATR